MICYSVERFVHMMWVSQPLCLLFFHLVVTHESKGKKTSATSDILPHFLQSSGCLQPAWTRRDSGTLINAQSNKPNRNHRLITSESHGPCWGEMIVGGSTSIFHILECLPASWTFLLLLFAVLAFMHLKVYPRKTCWITSLIGLMLLLVGDQNTYSCWKEQTETHHIRGSLGAWTSPAADKQWNHNTVLCVCFVVRSHKWVLSLFVCLFFVLLWS